MLRLARIVWTAIRYLAVALSSLLLLGTLYLQHSSMAWYLVRSSADGSTSLIAWRGDFIIERWDTPSTPGWNLSHVPPGDAFEAEMEVAHFHPVIPGVVASEWTHFPAAGGFYIVILSPNWLLAGFALLPAVELFVQMRRLFHRRRLRASGTCVKCGYDLRAHKPGERCPECGTAITNP